MKKKIVILAVSCNTTDMIYNALKDGFFIKNVIIENKIPASHIIRKRIKSLGFMKVIGQILFKVLLIPILILLSQKRIAEIKKIYDLKINPIPNNKIIKVQSVNDKRSILILEDLKPDVIVVNGTRIISEEVLSAITIPFLNIHTGITPLYRGVHGGYWALVQNNKNACGITIHLIDKGIDTGGILGQELISVNQKDNFLTYPYLQYGEGIPLLKKVLKQILVGVIKTIRPVGEGNSKLWSHPVIFEYLYNWFVKGIK